MPKNNQPGRRWYPKAVTIKNMKVQTTRSRGFIRDLNHLCKKYAGKNFSYRYIEEV